MFRVGGVPGEVFGGAGGYWFRQGRRSLPSVHPLCFTARDAEGLPGVSRDAGVDEERQVAGQTSECGVGKQGVDAFGFLGVGGETGGGVG